MPRRMSADDYEEPRRTPIWPLLVAAAGLVLLMGCSGVVLFVVLVWPRSAASTRVAMATKSPERPIPVVEPPPLPIGGAQGTAARRRARTRPAQGGAAGHDGQRQQAHSEASQGHEDDGQLGLARLAGGAGDRRQD